MRWSLLTAVFAWASIAGAHGPAREPLPANATATAVPSIPNSIASPKCKKLPIDADWPSPEEWKRELPGIETIMPQKLKHPQYTYEVTKVEQVQRAVKFVTKHNIRLSIYNSGHDFIGRNDAPSGLLLPVTGLRGIRLSPDYTPTKEGVAPLDSNPTVGAFSYVPGKQAVATVGGGVSATDLLLAIVPYGMITLTAAHRMYVLV
jgi:FAD/FMN-containing dehydrogenase